MKGITGVFELTMSSSGSSKVTFVFEREGMGFLMGLVCIRALLRFCEGAGFRWEAEAFAGALGSGGRTSNDFASKRQSW